MKSNEDMCASSSRNWKEGCNVNFHNISFFGLTRSESIADVLKKKTEDWTQPTQALIYRNKRRIRSFCEDIDKRRFVQVIMIHLDEDEHAYIDL